MGGGGGQRKVQPENKRDRSFLRGVGGGGGQRKAQPPKTSGHARFWCVWVVVVVRGRPNHRKRAVRLVFEWCGWWWWPEEAPTPENERLCSFSGWCWQEEGSTLENERLYSSSRGVSVFEGCGWLFVVVFRWCWQEEGPTPENERSCSFSRGVGGIRKIGKILNGLSWLISWISLLSCSSCLFLCLVNWSISTNKKLRKLS
jgi:hypothetical protein